MSHCWCPSLGNCIVPFHAFVSFSLLWFHCSGGGNVVWSHHFCAWTPSSVPSEILPLPLWHKPSWRFRARNQWQAPLHGGEPQKEWGEAGRGVTGELRGEQLDWDVDVLLNCWANQACVLSGYLRCISAFSAPHFLCTDG